MKHTLQVGLVLLFMGFLPFFFVDCNPCKCGDPGPDWHTRIRSFTAEYYTRSPGTSFDTATTYAFDSTGISLLADSVDFVTMDFQLPRGSFSFSQVAYACDCVEPGVGSLNYITAISFIAKKDISMDSSTIISKGSSLNPYFKVKQYSYDHPDS